MFICAEGRGLVMVTDQQKFLKGINLKKTSAWEELYRHFYGALCNYATGITTDRSVSEDIVQECLITIWKSNLVFTEIKALTVYLYRAVHNNTLKYLRDRNVSSRHLKKWQEDQEDVDEINFYHAVEEELVRRMNAAIENLPEQRRRILQLSIEGFTVQQIAEQLNISVNTVKTQKKRAYSFLKDKVKQCCILLVILDFLEKN